MASDASQQQARPDITRHVVAARTVFADHVPVNVTELPTYCLPLQTFPGYVLRLEP